MVALLLMSSWCLETVSVSLFFKILSSIKTDHYDSVLCLFLALPWVGLQCVIVVFTGHIYLLFKDHP